MTITEFSDEFDVLLNSYATGQISLELTEYEKSVFLTKAQEEIVRSLYSGKYLGDGFETSEEERRFLDALIKSASLSEVDKDIVKINSNSKFFQLPSDVWFITYESALLSDKSLGCKNNTTVDVVPVRQDEYNIIKENPFRGASDRRVLRIDSDSLLVELISKYTIQSYFVKYLSKPQPIILEDITTDNLKIEGESEAMGCKLNEALHRTILEGAVALAMKRLPSK